MSTWYSPLVIDIYSKTFGFIDTVAAPIWATATVRWNGIDTASFAVADDFPWSNLLSQPGTRAVVSYRPDPESPVQYTLLSGCVFTQLGDAGGFTKARTYYVTGDFSLWDQILGWPNPTGSITQQGDDEAYYEASGPAETVALSLLNLNKSRNPTPIVVPASQGRGNSISVRVRMHKLADKLFPVVGDAGVGIRMLQSGTSVAVQVYTGTTHTEPLTESDGVIVRGSYQITAPTATAVNVGGPGEGTARVWRRVVDTAAEARWARSWEVQVDARDVKTDDPQLAAKMDERGWEALREGAEKSSVNVELRETDDFQFITNYNVGDVWPVLLDGMEEPLTDRITRVDLSLTPDDGFNITPYMGNYEESTDVRVMKSVGQIARSVRDLKARI